MSEDKKPAAVHALDLPARTGSMYPEPYAAAVAGREKRALGNAFGLDQFGANLVRLPPGTASSKRHWHLLEDELIYVLEGELVLVTDAGEQVLGPGMVAGFKSGDRDGHHLVNRSDASATYLEVGSRRPGEVAEYPDIDLRIAWIDGKQVFVHKDTTPYD